MLNRRKNNRPKVKPDPVKVCTNCRQEGQLGRGVLQEITTIAQITAKVKTPIKYIVVKYRCDYCETESTTQEQAQKNKLSMLTARRSYNERAAFENEDGTEI